MWSKHRVWARTACRGSRTPASTTALMATAGCRPGCWRRSSLRQALATSCRGMSSSCWSSGTTRRAMPWRRCRPTPCSRLTSRKPSRPHRRRPPPPPPRRAPAGPCLRAAPPATKVPWAWARRTASRTPMQMRRGLLRPRCRRRRSWHRPRASPRRRASASASRSKCSLPGRIASLNLAYLRLSGHPPSVGAPLNAVGFCAWFQWCKKLEEVVSIFKASSSRHLDFANPLV
mmetsp:Transcript_86127/g.219482  ORF Transcript_86127/g.219482 Transcript_86127/m.219482 type:complete len:231 (-) Transcript_86127:23-715(-)